MFSSMMCVAHKLTLLWMFIILGTYSVSEATVVLNVNTTAGESTVLSCDMTIPSSINLKHLRFYWQDERNYVLYSFNEGQEMPGHVSRLYQNRTTAFPHEMTRGNISVTLQNPTLEDEQRVFKAFASILNSRGMSIHSHVQLICHITLHVAVPYKATRLVVDERAMTAVCTAERGFPEPLVSWRLSNDSKHSAFDLRDGHTKAVQGPGNQLYNASSTIDIHGSQYQSVTCCIYNPTLNVTLNETHIFNIGKQMRSLPVWAVCLIPAATLLLVKL